MLEQKGNVMGSNLEDQASAGAITVSRPAETRIYKSSIVCSKLAFCGIEGDEFSAHVGWDDEALTSGKNIELFGLEYMSLRRGSGEWGPVAVSGEVSSAQVYGRLMASRDVADRAFDIEG
jgi:hypothetical protein